MTFEIGVAEKESSANLPFVEIGRRGNVRADGDLNKRRIYDLNELFCAPQVRYTSQNLTRFSVSKSSKWPLSFKYQIHKTYPILLLSWVIVSTYMVGCTK